MIKNLFLSCIIAIAFFCLVGCPEKGKSAQQPSQVALVSDSAAMENATNEDLKKLDHRFREALADESIVQVEFFGKCNAPITEEMKKKLIESGAEINTVIKDSFTARCRKQAIYEIARLDFVVHLQFARKLEPLDNK